MSLTLSPLPNEICQIQELLEKRVTPDLIVDPHLWRQAMVQAELAVCRVEVKGYAIGTGFLVSPNLVLTCNHVRQGQPSFDDNPSSVQFSFGFRDNLVVSCRSYALCSQWHVYSSSTDDMDYCLCRLANDAGLDNMTDNIGNFKRGWIKLCNVDTAQEQNLFILQHPFGGPLRFASGTLSQQTNHWVDYRANTEEGSSGSPVFDNQWRCVALHSRATVNANRGILIAKILRSLPENVKTELGAVEDLLTVEGLQQSEKIQETIPVDRIQVSIDTLMDDELRLIARVIVDAAPKVRRDNDFVCDVTLRQGRRLQLKLNSDAFYETGMVLGLDGDLSIASAHEERIQNIRNLAAKGLAIDIASNQIISENERNLDKACMRIRDRTFYLVTSIYSSRPNVSTVS